MRDFCNRIGPMLDQLCPFHLAISAEGSPIVMGPSFAKLAPHVLDNLEASYWDPHGPVTLERMIERPLRNLRMHVEGVDDVHLIGQSFPVLGGAWLFMGPTLEEITKRVANGFRRDDFPDQMLIDDILFLIEAKSIVLAASTDVTARLQHEKSRAEHRALSDKLTGLGNRRAYDGFIKNASESTLGRCVMTLDLDKFKAVNDSLGHAAGDFILQHIARLLLEVTRREDEVIRMGGDEFVVILSGIRDRCSAEAIAERLLKMLKEPIYFRDTLCDVGISIGMAWQSDHPTATLAELTEKADHSLYLAKNNGRGQFKWHLSDEEMPRIFSVTDKSDPQSLQR